MAERTDRDGPAGVEGRRVLEYSTPAAPRVPARVVVVYTLATGWAVTLVAAGVLRQGWRLAILSDVVSLLSLAGVPIAFAFLRLTRDRNEGCAMAFGLFALVALVIGILMLGPSH
jgi:hypothetical protein